MKNQLKALLLAAIASSSQAFAAAPTDLIDAGDLIVGFYTASGTGAGRNLIVNIGAYQQFDNRDGSSIAVTSLAVQDLATIYGSNWNTRTDLVWSVTGATFTGSVDGLTRNTIFSASPRPTPGDTPSAIASTSDSGLAGDRPKIQAISDLFNAATDTTANSTVSINVDASLSNSFRAGQLSNNNIRFGPLGNNDADGLNITDLYALVPTSGGTSPSGNAAASGFVRGSNYLGYFTLDAAGLSYTATSAIPEPSTYAAIGGLVALGYAALRRRRRTQS
jgi:hypothetical protein